MSQPDMIACHVCGNLLRADSEHPCTTCWIARRHITNAEFDYFPVLPPPPHCHDCGQARRDKLQWYNFDGDPVFYLCPPCYEVRSDERQRFYAGE